MSDETNLYGLNMNSLKRELQLISALGGAMVLAGFGLIGLLGNGLVAGQWLLQAGLLWGWVCYFIGGRLALNRAHPELPLYADLGWGNRLTILRGLLIALTGGFLFLAPSIPAYAWFPALLYSTAAILDRLDGFAARRSQQVSLLGNELDISFDALGLVVAPLLAITQGRLHVSYLLLSVAYYLYQWALQRRLKQGLPIQALPDNPLRRTLAGFQMGFIAVALWPLLQPKLTIIAGVAFMLPVLLGFVLDWWVVTGRMKAQILTRLTAVSEQFFQPGLRLLLLPLMFWTLGDSSAAGWIEANSLLLGCVGLMLTGWAGRLGAGLCLVLLGWPVGDGGMAFSAVVLIFIASWILLLGTGRYSLWQWGDTWVARYDGAR